MCGICGVIDYSGAAHAPEVLKRMTDAIAHRGPDGEGVYIDGPAAFGHRRLAILDLSPAGAQPMLTDDGRYALTYNGEIYNFRELRGELEELGHRFVSTSDTEVVLKAYLQWGQSCVERFNGMFAFAIWDKVARTLFLARDRYGIKPLYYAFFNGTFLFGSEQKAILAHPTARREMDYEALLEYFTFQNIFTDRTLLKSIRTFPAGSTALLSERDFGTLSVRRYWDYDFREPEQRLSEAEYVEELDRLFHQAVTRQLVSDVEIGSYLSGGIDSGSITAIASQQNENLKSFTCGFDLRSASGLELAYDEREKSEYMSYLFRTEHYEMVLKSGDMERVLPAMAHHLEEPRMGQSYPNYYAAKLASRFVRVVLSGAGGDELFAGYPWRYFHASECTDFDEYIDKYYLYWQRLIPNRFIKEVFKPVWGEVGDVWTRDIFKNVFGSRLSGPCTTEESVNNSLYFEAKTFLSGLLTVDDKLSMAHGLESRVPFLDNDLVDFALQIPVSLKLGPYQDVKVDENQYGPKGKMYFHKTRNGKLILRDVLGRIVPDTISNGAKQGFSGPDGSWFRGESIELVKKVVFDDNSPIYGVFDKASIRALVGQHITGKKNRRLLIWSLLYFNEWLKTAFGE